MLEANGGKNPNVWKIFFLTLGNFILKTSVIEIYMIFFDKIFNISQC